MLGDLSFASTAYNCKYDDGLGKLRTGFSVRIDNDDIIGFRVSLISSGSSDSMDITNGVTGISNIGMLLGTNFGIGIVVPENGGVRTYVANDIIDKVEIYPILATGTKCDLADELKMQQCDDQQVSDQLAQY
jgi:hypothetical protein